jgi:hypothetical protein
MLDFPVDPLARLLLYALLAIWAGLLIFGLLLGRPDAARRNRLPLPVRMGLSITLVAAALVWWRAGAAGTALDRFGLFILLGMAFGFLGDLFMARLLVPAPKHIIFGILSFGAGHVWYILAYLQAGAVLGLDARSVWLGALVIYLAAAVALWLALVREPARGLALNAGTLGYSLLISAMAGAAAALAWQGPAFLPLALGGLLFIVSDLILGSEIMRRTHFPGIGDMIWVTYTVAQMLIVYSSSTALQLLP